MLKRITPDDLCIAYKAVGKSPVRNDQYSPLVAFCRAQFQVVNYNTAIRFLEEQGYETWYLFGFLHGFDGDGLPDDYYLMNQEQFELGHADGQKAWELCSKELLPKT